MLKKRQKAQIPTIQPLSNDPWSAANKGSEHIKDNWMMSYIDVLTLLLTLLVLLLGTQKLKSVPISTIMPSAQKNTQVAQIDSRELPNQKPLHETQPHKDIVNKSALELNDGRNDWLRDQIAIVLENLYQDEIQKNPLTAQSEIALINDVVEESRIGLLNNFDQIALSEPTKTDLVAEIEKISDNIPIEVIQEDTSVRIEFNDDLLFSSGQAELNIEGITILNKWVGLLRQQTGIIFVEGHTDNQLISTRRYPSNWELSASRAAAVTRYFVEHGIESDRLRAIGYADTRPRVNNNSLEARKRNRRVSIVIQT